jgi:hypothetical protein
MANMMRRVRGDAMTTVSAGPALEERESPAEAEATTIVESPHPDPIDDQPEILVDENGLLRLARKPQASTDMTALRELANTSARTAIAHHRQQRRKESAVSKAIICVMALAASVFALVTVRDFRNEWFWIACGTLGMAALMAAQLAALAWQRRGDRRRFATFAATAPAAAAESKAR